jgi:hypothetical protein
MNCKRILLGLLIIFQAISLFSQKDYDFTYDANGNRIKRELHVDKLKSATISFPVSDPSSLKLADKLKTTETDNNAVKTFIYPNPNKGLLKINVSNMPSNSTTELRIYNLSGTELMVKRNFDSYSEIDINEYKDGVYILRIMINDKLFDWKVVKSH